MTGLCLTLEIDYIVFKESSTQFIEHSLILHLAPDPRSVIRDRVAKEREAAKTRAGTLRGRGSEVSLCLSYRFACSGIDKHIGEVGCRNINRLRYCRVDSTSRP